ncbi:7-methylguanosine phosphate-specific 5'-nucleotidase A, partial [Tanacetum coccineum]
GIANNTLRPIIPSDCDNKWSILMELCWDLTFIVSGVDGNFASTTCIICTDSYKDEDADEFTFLTLKAMAERMISIRKQLLEALIAKDLNTEQVAFMTKEYILISMPIQRMQIKSSTLNGIDSVIECKCTIGAVGAEVLRRKLHRTFKNVKIVSNRMKFDQNGNLLSFTGKLIDSLNKNEHALDMVASLHDHLGEIDEQMIDIASVKKGTNVLLLGDHIGDLRMSDCISYENHISVGFL